MRWIFWTALVGLAMIAGATARAGAPESGNKSTAERFFRGVYTGDTTVVDELAADDVALRYPIFEQLFGVPEIRGRESVRRFASRFGHRWVDASITIRDAVEDGDRVVLLWSFRARSAVPAGEGAPPGAQVFEWGGMTLYRFDASGKIVAETGYEGDPTPIDLGSTTDSPRSH